ncbi:extracellular solute-binding protein [Nocardioides sp. CCNWLW239]|uniref:extracellular solute-binding protein n=1 Tax=Nocardioides sp. CCNWLW239 TaxID=3128902 RepID=UPI00301B05F1
MSHARKRPGTRFAVGVASAAVLAGTLAACGTDTDSTALTWYIGPDGAPAKEKIAEACSTDDYTIQTELLPTGATDQRTQLARRLAADDPSMDLIDIDPVFVPEFASAGWLLDIPDEYAERAVDDDVLDGPASSVKWEDEVVAFPQWANTQVLWYRPSLAEKAGLSEADMEKVTWDQVIDAAADNGGTVGVQANKYEGYMVWINALIQGAGGSIVEDTEAGTDAKVTIDSDAGKQAAAVIAKLAASPAAQPDLSISNEGTSLGQMFPQGGAGEFMVNWTFAYANYRDTVGAEGGPPDEATFKDDFAWARYPRTNPETESTPPIGGFDIGIGAFTDEPDAALKAAGCLTGTDAQVTLALEAGLMPARTSAYQDPKLVEAFPPDLLALYQDSIDDAGLRPASAYYSKISGAVQSTWHAPDTVDPDKTPEESATFLEDVLEGKSLL